MRPYFIDDNEKIIWEGKPSKLMYFFNGFNIIFFIFVIVWLLVFTSIWSGFSIFSGEFREVAQGSFFERQFDMFMLIPFIVFLAFASVFILGPIRRFIESFKVKYYITDLRVYIESGIIGRDIQNIEYKEINKLNVNVGILGKMLNRGTISLTPDESYYSGDTRYIRSGIKLIGVETPYELYKLLKKNALDVTTDQQYPNVLRPDKNTGYNTELDNE